MNNIKFPQTSRRTATPLIESEKKLDEHGLTNPDLYRRMESVRPVHDKDEEVLPRDYKFTIAGTDSYRTTHKYIQDDNSDEVEIP